MITNSEPAHTLELLVQHEDVFGAVREIEAGRIGGESPAFSGAGREIERLKQLKGVGIVHEGLLVAIGELVNLVVEHRDAFAEHLARNRDLLQQARLSGFCERVGCTDAHANNKQQKMKI